LKFAIHYEFRCKRPSRPAENGVKFQISNFKYQISNAAEEPNRTVLAIIYRLFVAVVGSDEAPLSMSVEFG
jgi:hypothetical protein